jgi:hypothetical protein
MGEKKMKISAPDRALSYAQADLARALNYAALEAVKKLGETPVIKPDNNSEYYNGTNPVRTETIDQNWDMAYFPTSNMAAHLQRNDQYCRRNLWEL